MTLDLLERGTTPFLVSVALRSSPKPPTYGQWYSPPQSRPAEEHHIHDLIWQDLLLVNISSKPPRHAHSHS